MKSAFKIVAGILRKLTVAIGIARWFTRAGASRIGAVVVAAVMCLGLAACGGGGGGSGSAAPMVQPTPVPVPQGDVQVRYNLPGVANGLTQSVPRNIADSPTRASYWFPLTIDDVEYIVELTMQNGQIVRADARRVVAVSPPVATPPVTPSPPPIVIDPNGTSGGIPNRLILAAGTGMKDPRAGFYTGRACGQVRDVSGLSYECNIDSQGYPVKVEDADFRNYRDGAQFGHRRIQGSTDNPRLEVRLPPQDVRAAWRDGWTGHGVNILVIDLFGGKEVTEQNRLEEEALETRHGYLVTMAAKQIAGRARFYFLDSGGVLGRRYGNFGDPDPISRHYSPLNVDRGVSYQVINLSIGSPLREDDDGRPRAPTEREAWNYRHIRNNSWRHLIYPDVRPTGPRGRNKGLEGTEDAVLVKAAENNSVDASWHLMNLMFLSEEQLASRVLIVGALTHFPRASTANEPSQVSTSARLAKYSNFAGSRRQMQERFLVAYAGIPWRAAYLCQNDDTPSTCDIEQALTSSWSGTSARGGTSSAAPRVAGYAALVRDKFPELSGPQTAKILLDTATYEGLVCHPNCRPEIYGQGRVDITDALSPIGKLE